MNKGSKRLTKSILVKVAKKLKDSNRQSKFVEDKLRSFMIEVIKLLNGITSEQILLKTLKQEEKKTFPKHEVGNFLNLLEGLKEGHPSMTPELKKLVQSIKPEDAITIWEA